MYLYLYVVVVACCMTVLCLCQCVLSRSSVESTWIDNGVWVQVCVFVYHLPVHHSTDSISVSECKHIFMHSFLCLCACVCVCLCLHHFLYTLNTFAFECRCYAVAVHNVGSLECKHKYMLMNWSQWSRVQHDHHDIIGQYTSECRVDIMWKRFESCTLYQKLSKQKAQKIIIEK